MANPVSLAESILHRWRELRPLDTSSAPFIPADAAVIPPEPPGAIGCPSNNDAPPDLPHARDATKMHEIRKSRFLPRWAREENAALAFLGDMPNVGPDPESDDLPGFPDLPSVVVTDVSGTEADAPTPGWWRVDVYRHEARRHTLYVLPARPGSAGETEAVARAVAGFLAGGGATG